MNRRRALMATQNGGEKPILNPSIGYTENYKLNKAVAKPYLQAKDGCAVTDFIDAGTSGNFVYFNPSTPSIWDTSSNSNCGNLLIFSTLSESSAYSDWWNCGMAGQQKSVTISSTKRYIRLNIPMENLDGAYAYSSATGKIHYAGKNTPYYGHTNISEVSA